MGKHYSRREFVKQNSLAGLGAAVAIGLTPALLAEKSDLDDVATVIERIHKNAEKINNSK